MNFNFDDKKRQIIVLVVAIVMGLLATTITGNFVKKSIDQSTEKLAKDFKQRSDAEKQAMALKMEEMSAQMDQKLQRTVEEIKNSIPKEAPKKEEPKPQPVSPLSTKMPPDKRAVTIPMSPLAAVGGLVNPGDFVDVIVKLQIPNPQKPQGDTDPVTSIVFQNIQVLAVDSKVQPISNQKELEDRLKAKEIYVTLAMSAEESGLMSFAQANGAVTLSMRSPGQKDTEKLEVANWESLAEFVEKNQGTKILIPEKEKKIEAEEEASPVVQIFKSGIEY